jgi:hypothetical protein
LRERGRAAHCEAGDRRADGRCERQADAADHLTAFAHVSSPTLLPKRDSSGSPLISTHHACVKQGSTRENLANP